MCSFSRIFLLCRYAARNSQGYRVIRPLAGKHQVLSVLIITIWLGGTDVERTTRLQKRLGFLWLLVMVYTGKATGDIAVEAELLSKIGGLQGKLTLCKPILEGVVIQIYKKTAHHGVR